MLLNCIADNLRQLGADQASLAQLENGGHTSTNGRDDTARNIDRLRSNIDGAAKRISRLLAQMRKSSIVNARSAAHRAFIPQD